MSEIKESDPELFMKYNYPETKDMCKQFLTLVSTLLVVSLTFSDKVVNFSTASSAVKWIIVLAWIFLLLAIICCGLGLLLITIAAGDAVYQKFRYKIIAGKSYNMIVTAGGCFILGLVLLIATAVASLRTVFVLVPGNTDP